MSRDLPAPGLADHAHHLRATSPHSLEGGREPIQLVAAADQRGGEAEVGEAPRRSRLRQDAQQAMDGDRLGLALQRQLARRLEGEPMAAEGVGRVRRPGPSRGRRREQAGGGVHGVAGHRVGARRPVAPRLPATTGPVWTPDVQGHGAAEPRRPLAARASRCRSRMSSAAPSARCGSSSWATGAPKTAITASPTNFSTKPS